jgi:cytosine deaminase
MLEVAHMGLHVAQMTGVEQMAAMFDAVTVNGARTLGLGGYGLESGCRADLVILQAGDVHEALRLRPARLYVIRQGRVISRSAPVVAHLDLDGEPHEVDFRLPE